MLGGLAGFLGARRRFEVRGEVDGVTVVDDYAHNPPKVAAVVGTAAEIVARSGSGRLHVVFQPHLYSRTRDFAQEFARALAPADTVVLLDVYGAREQPVEGITSALIGDPLTDLPGERRVLVGASPDDAVAAVVATAGPGDLVLTVGAGDVTAARPARPRGPRRAPPPEVGHEPGHHPPRPRRRGGGQPLPGAGAVPPAQVLAAVAARGSRPRVCSPSSCGSSAGARGSGSTTSRSPGSPEPRRPP